MTLIFSLLLLFNLTGCASFNLDVLVPKEALSIDITYPSTLFKAYGLDEHFIESQIFQHPFFNNWQMSSSSFLFVQHIKLQSPTHIYKLQTYKEKDKIYTTLPFFKELYHEVALYLDELENINKYISIHCTIYFQEAVVSSSFGHIQSNSVSFSIIDYLKHQQDLVVVCQKRNRLQETVILLLLFLAILFLKKVKNDAFYPFNLLK